MDKQHDALYEFGMGRIVSEELLENAKINGYGSSPHDNEIDDPMDRTEALEFFSDDVSFEDASLLQAVALGHEISAEESARVAILEAQRVVREEYQRLNEYHLEHPAYSAAIRDWVFEGMRCRGLSPGEDLLDVQAEVILCLVEQLEQEDEDPIMIGFARSWHHATIDARTSNASDKTSTSNTIPQVQ